MSGEGEEVGIPAGRAQRLLRAQTRLLELMSGGGARSEILEHLCRTIEREIDGALTSILVLEGDRLRLGAAPSLPPSFLAAADGLRIGPGVGSCGNAAFTGAITIVEEIEVHPYWETARELARQHDLRSCWSSPIRGSDGAVIGTFAIYQRRPSRPSPAEIELIAGTTHIAGIAIERRRLDDSLARRTAELLEADRQKDVFLATLAHELRNPLAPIRTAVEVMQNHPENAVSTRRALAVVDRQVRHLSLLVNDLLDVSRISCGRIELHRERAAIDGIIGEAMDVARPELEARHHRVSIRRPQNAPLVDVDRARMIQILTNLMNNAAKYTAPGGEIDVSVQIEDEELTIVVADTGVGMSPETTTQVFDLFFQADQSLDRSQGGLGIGLTMVKRLVELHGGTITAASAGLGRGSVFSIRLPDVVPRAVPTGLAEALRPQARLQGQSVLVVDDNVDAAEMLSIILASKGFDVRVAGDGPAALVACDHQVPDAVVLDIGLPGIDGYEVARRLRQRFPGRTLRVITLSGYGQSADRADALAAGADQALVKPVDIDSLVDALRVGTLVESPLTVRAASA